jgi:hypothetical protein
MSTRRVKAVRYETYHARADARVARAVAKTNSPFTIQIRFLGGLTTKQKNAFKLAAKRWTRVIVGDLPSVVVEGELIDDVLITAEGADIDGTDGILGQAGPTHLRPKAAGRAAFLPARGAMTFDTADLRQMERDKALNDVITHEMGHVLGIGTIWEDKKLLRGVGGSNPTFGGKHTMAEYKVLRGGGVLRRVPVENGGGEGTRDSHWRETVFHNELMSGFVEAGGNPLSRLTVASLKDLGYEVNLDAAEAYVLPNLMSLAERGELTTHAAPVDRGKMLPIIPTVLPNRSLA